MMMTSNVDRNNIIQDQGERDWVADDHGMIHHEVRQLFEKTAAVLDEAIDDVNRQETFTSTNSRRLIHGRNDHDADDNSVDTNDEDEEFTAQVCRAELDAITSSPHLKTKTSNSSHVVPTQKNHKPQDLSSKNIVVCTNGDGSVAVVSVSDSKISSQESMEDLENQVKMTSDFKLVTRMKYDEDNLNGTTIYVNDTDQNEVPFDECSILDMNSSADKKSSPASEKVLARTETTTTTASHSRAVTTTTTDEYKMLDTEANTTTDTIMNPKDIECPNKKGRSVWFLQRSMIVSLTTLIFIALGMLLIVLSGRFHHLNFYAASSHYDHENDTEVVLLVPTQVPLPSLVPSPVGPAVEAEISSSTTTTTTTATTEIPTFQPTAPTLSSPVFQRNTTIHQIVCTFNIEPQ